MEVGVLDMYPDSIGSWRLIKAVNDLGYNPVVFNSKTESLYKIVRQSGIKKWIFSGSPQSVHSKESTQIPLDVFKHSSKDFLLICYSMESVMKQVGLDVLERYENRKGYFNLHIQKGKALIFGKEWLFEGIKSPCYLWRNHHCYTPSTSLEDINELASYRGELMIAFHKHLLFMQFHPERSADGKRLLKNWLQGN